MGEQANLDALHLVALLDPFIGFLRISCLFDGDSAWCMFYEFNGAVDVSEGRFHYFCFDLLVLLLVECGGLGELWLAVQ